MKLWGGRFAKETDKDVNDFNSSISFDWRMYKEDIEGSIAHVTMLGAQGIIERGEADNIVRELERIGSEIEAGIIAFSAEAEDIHMNIETILTSRLGLTGKRLHTGRSRNDQVALDFRMYIMRRLGDIKKLVLSYMSVLLDKAKAHIETIMPGYTHLQRAQPITLAHHLMAWCQMLTRDVTRIEDAIKRMDEMPLGAGALAATTYPLDRRAVADSLGFSSISPNSLDAVSDRDFAVETLSVLSILMMHLSRMAEEVIMWCSHEFGFANLDDAYSTGSSIMPQKKNPDVAELVRGKTGRVFGSLIGLLTVMKGLPLAYNKDMQEDKEAVFDALDTTRLCLTCFAPMIETLTFNSEKMRTAASQGFINATDASDYLVRKGLPFRDAYTIVGHLVKSCISGGQTLETLDLDALKEISPVFDSDFYEAISLETCVKRRCITGGPAPETVREHIAEMEMFISRHKAMLSI